MAPDCTWLQSERVYLGHDFQETVRRHFQVITSAFGLMLGQLVLHRLEQDEGLFQPELYSGCFLQVCGWAQ